MGLFWAAHGWGDGGQKGPLSKISHTYPQHSYTLAKEGPNTT